MVFVSFLVVLFGCINWLSIGMLQYDIVAGFFGTQSSIFSRVIYILVGFAAIWLVISAIKEKGKIHLFKRRKAPVEEERYERDRYYGRRDERTPERIEISDNSEDRNN